MKVRIGYAPGPFPAHPDGRGRLRRLVELGEAHAYDSLWLSDRIVGHRFPLEPVVGLAMAAAWSERLKVGTSVLALPPRNPVLLAKQLATLDWLCGGRLLPAVGLGHDDPHEDEATGIGAEGRAARLDEAILLLRRLWQEERVTHQGRFYRLHQIGITPRPARQPCPPLWIGGRSPAAQRRVGRLGDGWLASQVTPDEVARGRELIFATAARHGRQVDRGHLGVVLGFHLAPSVEAAAALAEPFVLGARPDLPFTACSALGPPEAVAARLREYLAAGASKFVVRPLAPPDQAVQQLEAFGRAVLPAFHAP